MESKTNISQKRDGVLCDYPESNEDNFKAVFKKYKSRLEKLDLSEVVDFRLKDICHSRGVEKHQALVKLQPDSDVCSKLGLRPVKDWESFTLVSSPGFIFIRNPFKRGHQRYWLTRLLQDIPNPTNKTNLPGLPADSNSIWMLHNQRSSGSEKTAFSQLRWVTLGYHYNWNTKLYDSDDVSPFPEDIGLLSAFVASSLGFKGFRAEAAIVNYYKMDSTLGGHSDHSEVAHDAPLISFSFGQSAIFLVGGLTKAVKPTPILLRSGDIIILSSLSRLAFHGVPRIHHDDPENLKLCWGEVAREVEKQENPKTSIATENCENLKSSKQVYPEIHRKSLVNMCNEDKEQGLYPQTCNKVVHCRDESSCNDECPTVQERVHISTIDVLPKKKHMQTDCHKKMAIKSLEKNLDEQNTTSLFQNDHCNISDRCNICPVADDRFLSSLDVQCPVKGNDTAHLLTKRLSKQQNSGAQFMEMNLNVKRVKVDVSTPTRDCLFKVSITNAESILHQIHDETVRLSQYDIWEPFEKHLQNTRLNVSVRQVNI